jgi:hypothetical protein
MLGAGELWIPECVSIRPETPDAGFIAPVPVAYSASAHRAMRHRYHVLGRDRNSDDDALRHTGRWTMKAIVVADQAARTTGMTLVEQPEPQAAINDVIVQIHASVHPKHDGDLRAEPDRVQRMGHL